MVVELNEPNRSMRKKMNWYVCCKMWKKIKCHEFQNPIFNHPNNLFILLRKEMKLWCMVRLIERSEFTQKKFQNVTIFKMASKVHNLDNAISEKPMWVGTWYISTTNYAKQFNWYVVCCHGNPNWKKIEKCHKFQFLFPPFITGIEYAILLKFSDIIRLY